MAQRTVALYNGQYIGIETIFTVVNGQQINIPEKLADLRIKSRNEELFCPCGCGTNLILVAGDKNLREQHFREKTGTGNRYCTMPIEGKVSVNSKIALKCWLDDKLKTDDIEARVPITSVEASKRKPEFTFLSRSHKFAIRYWYTRANIMDDRIDILDTNISGIKVLYIVDIANGGNEGQYPEALMKIQNKQQYCFLLSSNDMDYDKAFMKVVYYDKNIDGIWEEIEIAKNKLINYSIDGNNEVYVGNSRINDLYKITKAQFDQRQTKEKTRREEAERQRLLQQKRAQEERERQIKEYQKQQEELEKRRQAQAAEAEKKRKEQEEKQKAEEECKKQEEQKLRDEFVNNLNQMLEQQEKMVHDPDGNRWLKCEFCGKTAMEKDFATYGGANHINLGTCKECQDNNPEVKKRLDMMFSGSTRKIDPNVCPECGGMLREKSGRFGSFMGCSNFPKCRFTKQIRK